MGEQEKGCSQKKLKSLIKVPYVAHLKVQVLSFNKNRICSPKRVPRPSYPFRDKFRRSRNVSFTEKAIIVFRGALHSGRENTCSKLQYDHYFISVAYAFLHLVIHFGKKLGEQVKSHSPKKL